MALYNHHVFKVCNTFRSYSLIVLVLLISLLPDNNAYAFFFKKDVKKEEAAIKVTEDTKLKAKAVWLELEGDSVEYDHDQNIYITSGNSIAHIVDQNAKLEADKIIYYGKDKHIEAVGNIKITHEGVVTGGSSFTFDVNSNKYLLTEPETVVKGAVIKAREASSLDDSSLQYQKGTLKMDAPVRIAQGFGAKKHPRTFYSQRASKIARKHPSWEDLPKQGRYKVTAEKIVYDDTKKVNNLTVYGARIHFKHFSLPTIPKFTTTVSSDEHVRSAPLISPTIGTQGALGGFLVCPSFNLNIKDYYILSLSPFAQIGDRSEFGAGGKIGFLGPSTEAQGYYGSLRDRFVAEGRQKLGPKTEFRFGYNQYFDEGFLGRNLAEINVGLVDNRKIKFPFTEEGIRFRTSANWIKPDLSILPSRFKELQIKSGEQKKFEDNAFKFEEQISLVTKPLFKIGTQKFNTALRLRTRNALRVYTTGDLQGIFTGGPILGNTLGPLSFELGYDQAINTGDSPLQYDQYIQGKQSVSLDGDIRFGEWLTLGGYGTFNIKDQEIVERQIRAKFGPKDFKMLVNWDNLRQQVQFGVNFLFGEPVDFEKFLILSSHRNSGVI